MPRQTWIADVLADAFRGVKGFQFEVYAGASTRGSTSFDPIGVMNHHTGAGRYDALLHYMATGSSIAPLCNWATSRPHNGIVRITFVTAGRANHAGRGGAGRGGTPWITTDSGNRLTIGGEHQNDGSQPWPDQQLEAIYRGSAALLKVLKQNEERAALHKTYAPGRKPDMHTVTLATHQAGIRHFLLDGGGTPAPEPKLGDRILYLTDPMMRGGDVTELQTLLNRWRSDIAGDPDGVFGTTTNHAVHVFMRDVMDVTTDNPRVGPKTVAALRDAVKPAPAPTPAPTPPPTRRYDMLLMGARGVDYDTASAVINATGARGVVTTSAAEAREVMDQGVKTIYVGGPAVREALGREPSGPGVVWHRNGQVATVVGQTAIDTLAHLVLVAKNGWKP